MDVHGKRTISDDDDDDDDDDPMENRGWAFDWHTSPLTLYHVMQTVGANVSISSVDLHNNLPVGKFVRRIGGLCPTIYGLFFYAKRTENICLTAP